MSANRRYFMLVGARWRRRGFVRRFSDSAAFGFLWWRFGSKWRIGFERCYARRTLGYGWSWNLSIGPLELWGDTLPPLTVGEVGWW